jgi:predicted phage tail protein
MNDNQEAVPETRLSRGGWLAIIVLVAFLGWAIWYAAHTWGALAGVGISPAGWVMLGLGVVVTLIVGGGLMALLFYSSRKNYDR